MEAVSQGPVVQGERLEIRPGRFISVAHRPVANNNATTLFFVHGGGGNKDQWRFLWQAPQLAGYHLVAWDLLGHGASDVPRQASAYAWDELVADQLAVQQRFAGPRNILIAHSVGSALTLSSVLRLEQREAITGILLLGTQLQAPDPGRLLALPVWLLKLLRPLLARGFRRAAWHPATDRALVEYEERLARNNPLYVLKALLRQSRWIPTELGTLKMPVKILSGAADRLTSPDGGNALHRRIPGSGFEILPGTAHQLMLEQPEVVLEHLLALLRERGRTFSLRLVAV